MTNVVCHACGLIVSVPAVEAGHYACCPRCHSAFKRRDSSASVRCAAFAGTAFVLFWPAILLPIITIEKLGHRSQNSIVDGIRELFLHHDWFVGSVVLLFSVVFPLVKMMALLELSLFQLVSRKHRAITYHLMELLGKWSMMDVLLLAFFVMLIKLGSLVTFHYGPAVVYFTLCVGFSILASLSFDPHSIWDNEP